MVCASFVKECTRTPVVISCTVIIYGAITIINNYIEEDRQRRINSISYPQVVIYVSTKLWICFCNIYVNNGAKMIWNLKFRGRAEGLKIELLRLAFRNIWYIVCVIYNYIYLIDSVLHVVCSLLDYIKLLYYRYIYYIIMK